MYLCRIAQGCAYATSRDPLIEFDLDVHSRRQFQLHQGVHRFVGGIDDIHETFVGAQFILVPGVFVDVGGDEYGEPLDLGWQRHRTFDGCSGALGRLHNLAGRLVDQAMIESLEANPNVLVCRH